jgi:hypothetical protein
MLWRAASLAAVGVFIAGCMALPKSDTAVLQDPPLASKGTVPLKAGMMTLRDARPAQEREALRGMEDLAERVTLNMVMDFGEAKVFSSIKHVTEPKDADVILRGEIRSFQWSPGYIWYPYVPGLGILAAFGVPVATSTAEVAIALEVVDPKKDQPIVSYTKAVRESQRYFVYRYQDFRAGDDRERNSAFRRVADELQTAILGDQDRIVAAVGPAAR